MRLGNANIDKGSSPSKDKKFLCRLSQTRPTALFNYSWYIQYRLPFSERESRADDGLRALTLPAGSNLLPTIPVIVNQPEPLSEFWFWKKLLEPQLTEAKYMLATVESMYRNQQKRNIGEDYGKITFSVKLSENSFIHKLNYIHYVFPDHPELELDYVCPNCGLVTHYNWVISPEPTCTICERLNEMRTYKRGTNRFGEAICPYCKRVIGLQKNGMFRKHGKIGENCEGSWTRVLEREKSEK